MFRISKDSPVFYLTSVTNSRLPVFKNGFMEKLNYIHLNPVQARLMERAEDNRWSSVRCWLRRPLDDEPLLMDIDL